MKVLRLICGLDPSHGGPAVSSMNSIIATQRAGAEITFAIPLEPSGRTAIEPAIKQLEQEGVSVVTFDCATGPEKLFPGWGVNRELASWIRQNRQDFDIVHCHGAWQMVTLLTSFSSGTGPARALTPHESLTNFDITQSPNAVTKFLKPRLKARFLKKFDLFVMSSTLEARDSLPPDIAASPHTAVISHPVYDDTLRTLSVRTETASDNPLRIGYLGRLHQKKNLDLLIEALANLDADVSLTVAGTGPEEGALKAKAATLGVADRINWLGFIHDKEAFFAQIDILVMPSEYECFGMAAAEAIVDGIPVIVSRETGIAEIIERNGGGQIIESTTNQIVSALQEFLAQPEHRNTLSQQAIQCAEQALSFKKHGEATVEAYQKLLERTKHH